jgi:hypothetical protein
MEVWFQARFEQDLRIIKLTTNGEIDKDDELSLLRKEMSTKTEQYAEMSALLAEKQQELNKLQRQCNQIERDAKRSRDAEQVRKRLFRFSKHNLFSGEQ